MFDVHSTAAVVVVYHPGFEGCWAWTTNGPMKLPVYIYTYLVLVSISKVVISRATLVALPLNFVFDFYIADCTAFVELFSRICYFFSEFKESIL